MNKFFNYICKVNNDKDHLKNQSDFKTHHSIFRFYDVYITLYLGFLEIPLRYCLFVKHINRQYVGMFLQLDWTFSSPATAVVDSPLEILELHSTDSSQRNELPFWTHWDLSLCYNKSQHWPVRKPRTPHYEECSLSCSHTKYLPEMECPLVTWSSDLLVYP